MMPLSTVLWGFVLIFGLMGALRGWAKEILVSFSVIVALAMRLIFSKYVPFIKDILSRPPIEQFYIYGALVVFMAIAGYAGPAVSAQLAGKAAREKLQDILLGFIVGAFNGYMIVGILWSLLHDANYGIWNIQPPLEGTTSYLVATQYLPLAWVSDPLLLTIFVLAAVFLVIVLV
ncbi:MAG: CvpA family protein [Chloroflexota bacterium]|nr:CvpA family protein [Chloroflexota bacterium]